MAVKAVFAGVAVADLDSALDWYESLLGGPPEMAPNEAERAWRLTEEGWIYVVQDPEHAGNALLTLMVDDLDARLAALAERGISAGGIEILSATVRKVVVTDPEGNRIQLGEAISSAG